MIDSWSYAEFFFNERGAMRAVRMNQNSTVVGKKAE